MINTAYGAPEKDKFPFDMAHKRYPYPFNVPEAMGKVERDKARAKIAADLAEIILGMLTKVGEKVVEPPVFPEAPPAWKSSSFLENGILGNYAHPALDQPLPIPWENGLQWFLRLVPLRPIEGKSYRELFDHASKTPLRPFGPRTAPSIMVNAPGAVSFDQRPEGKPIRSFSQLFRSGEIWGIERATEYAETEKVIPFSNLVTAFTTGLEGYLDFLRDELKIQPPLKLIAGISGAEGCSIADRRFMDPAGHSPGDEIIYETVLETLEVEPAKVLAPFFQMVWGDFTLPGAWDS